MGIFDNIEFDSRPTCDLCGARLPKNGEIRFHMSDKEFRIATDDQGRACNAGYWCNGTVEEYRITPISR